MNIVSKSWRQLLQKARGWAYSFNVDGTGYRGMGGGSYAGLPVTRDTALQSATVAGCVNLIGTTIAFLGFDVYRQRKGSAEVVEGHELHEILKWEPNRQQTADEFWQRMFYDIELSGNAYARIDRTRSNGIVGIRAWHPDAVSIDTGTTPEWTYKYENGTDRESVPERDLDQLHNILHMRNVTTDGVLGLSTVSLARQRIGLDLAVEKYAAMFFGKGGRVKDIFKTPGTATLSNEQRAKFKQIFREEYGNADAFHEAMLLEAGIELAGKSGATPNEAQFIETQTSVAIAICRFFGVPPTFMGILDRATYNNQEQLALQFLQFGLGTRVQRAEKAIRRALITPKEKQQGFYIHSRVQKLMRADTKTRGEFYKTLCSLGAMNAEEIRELEDMPAIGTDEAAEYRRAVNIFGPDEAATDAGAEAGRDAATEEARRAAA